jgi:hypothetical protein
MNAKGLGALLFVVAVGAGCVTGQPAGPARAEFDDIPIPSGLTYVEDKAVIIESPGVKAARLLYRGRVSVATLGPALRSGMETSGWKNVSSTTTGPRGTVQIYEKDRSALQLRLWEDIYFTYVEVTTSRLTPPTAGSPAAAITPAADSK